MNVEEKLISMLIEKGMFEQQAIEVIDLVKVSEKAKSMSSNWLKDANGYPSIVMDILWIATKETAFKWAEDNKPDAWFKELLRV